jgi:putative membrane protein
MTEYNPHYWWRYLLRIEGSMFREIVLRLIVPTLWCVGVVVLFDRGHKLTAPLTVHGLVGTVMGLLLVFRTNASYDRFWEGRKLWGGIVNETRNLIRAAEQPLREAKELHAQLLLWTSIYPWAVVRTLRANVGDLGPAAAQLPADEIAKVLAAKNPGVAVARQLSAVLGEARRRGLISDFVQMTLDQNVQLLVDYQGGCERIHRTPLPFSYVVHLRRLLFLYIYTLPFVLVETYGWLTLPAVFVCAFFFFGIEEIGVEIEDPFDGDANDLPLKRISAGIGETLKEMGS